MPSLSWDGMVEHYDETRQADARCFAAALDELAGRFPPEDTPCVLEPGVGNGRIAIPLAQRGYHVTGIDISEEMLAALGKKIAGTPWSARIEFAAGDVAALPFPDAAFDLAVVSHLFWFVADWKRALRELRRVLRPAGPVVLLNTGGGLEIARLNDRYKALCAEAGHPIRNAGAATTKEVLDELAGMEYRIEEIRDKWMWTASIEVAGALGFIERRAYSFTRLVPEGIHQAAIA